MIMIQKNKKQQIGMLAFLLVELVLYYFILTAGGTTLVITSFASIVICFLYCAAGGKKSDPLFIAALACTVGADFFLVICSPIEQLYGMICFLTAQTLYAIRLHRDNKNRVLMVVRIVLILCAEVITVAVLKENTDALAMISLAYYANLVMNIAISFTLLHKNKLLPIGFVLFLLCDTVIGLQMASGVYLNIPEGSMLHSMIFVGFNLAWFFYLPSQVLIALSSRRK